MLKLRTMHVAADREGSITTGEDPRISAAGRWLRRLKVDEIPQLINVLRGEMAFFGPRPEAPDIVERHYKPWMLETLEVPPGIVGPGSLGYFSEEAEIPHDRRLAEDYYAAVLLPRKLARDLVFVRSASSRYRAELLARTILGVAGLDRLMTSARVREHDAAEAILRELEPNS